MSLSNGKGLFMQKAGNVNSCVFAFIHDEQGKSLAKCYGTPNAMAYAMSQHPSAVSATLFYAGWEPEAWDREKIGQDRILNAGWMTAKQAGYEARA
jgi:hypothetical protein